MKLGLFIGGTARNGGPERDHEAYSRLVQYVTKAELLGFASAFLVEHHFSGFGQPSSSLNLLTYIAGVTRRIRLGTAVVVLPWHNPILLAEQIAILDQLSDGRLDLGIGRGYRSSEARGFAIDEEQLQARFNECFEILGLAWTSPKRFSHSGQFWSFEDVLVEPSTYQRPHPPLWVAAGSPDSIRAAAHEGFNLLLDQLGSIETTIERVEIYREAVEAAGSQFSSNQIAVTRALHLADDEAELEKAYEARSRVLKVLSTFPHGEVSGTPKELLEASGLLGSNEQVVGQLARLEQAGVGTVLLTEMTLSIPILERVGSEIMPVFDPSPVSKCLDR